MPTVDDEEKFVGGAHAHGYVPPNVGVRPWAKVPRLRRGDAVPRARVPARGPREPFFLVVSFHHPHDPFHVTQEIDVRRHPERIEYYAMDRCANEAHSTDEVDLDSRSSS